MMRDKDQKLIFEAYGQLNEASLDPREAIERMRGAVAAGQDDLIPDILKMVDRHRRPMVIKKAQELGIQHPDINPGIPPLPIPPEHKSSTPDPNLGTTPGPGEYDPYDVVADTIEINQRADAATDDLIDKFELSWMKEPNNWDERDKIKVLFKTLLEIGFNPHEAVYHYEDDDTKWLLGAEHENHIKVTFLLSDGRAFAKLYSEIDFEVFDETANLSDNTQIVSLIGKIKEQVTKLKGDDDKGESALDF